MIFVTPPFCHFFLEAESPVTNNNTGGGFSLFGGASPNEEQSPGGSGFTFGFGSSVTSPETTNSGSLSLF